MYFLYTYLYQCFILFYRNHPCFYTYDITILNLSTKNNATIVLLDFKKKHYTKNMNDYLLYFSSKLSILFWSAASSLFAGYIFAVIRTIKAGFNILFTTFPTQKIYQYLLHAWNGTALYKNVLCTFTLYVLYVYYTWNSPYLSLLFFLFLNKFLSLLFFLIVGLLSLLILLASSLFDLFELIN